jgi:hypothetical protein
LASSNPKTFSEDRLGFRVRRTRKLHDEFVTYEAWAEKTRASGVPVGDGLDLIREELDESVERAFTRHPESKLTSPAPAQPPQTKPLQQSQTQEANPLAQSTPIDPILLSELESQDFQDFKTPKLGKWSYADQLSKSLLDLLAKGPIVVHGFEYKLSGSDQRFLNKWPRREK